MTIQEMIVKTQREVPEKTLRRRMRSQMKRQGSNGEKTLPTLSLSFCLWVWFFFFLQLLLLIFMYNIIIIYCCERDNPQYDKAQLSNGWEREIRERERSWWEHKHEREREIRESNVNVNVEMLNVDDGLRFLLRWVGHGWGWVWVRVLTANSMST